MKGRAKVLNSKFMEFIEYLQKIGELHNIMKIIDSISVKKTENCEKLHTELDESNMSGIDMLFFSWQKGWIEIRETERRGKDWHRKEYALLVQLEEIAAYCGQENSRGFKPSGYSLSEQDVEVLV